MKTSRKFAVLLVLFALCLSSIGCGGNGDRPDLGGVYGTITMDGAPLVGVNVYFHPTKGRAAVAMTDEEGRYKLTYVHGTQGAKTGPAEVEIVWPTGIKGSVAIPEKYNTQTKLKVDVKESGNVFDFHLKSS